VIAAAAEADGADAFHVFRQALNVGGNVVEDPVADGFAAVRVVHDERVALGAGRRAGPFERWRAAVAVTGKFFRHRTTVRHRRTAKDKGAVRLAQDVARFDAIQSRRIRTRWTIGISRRPTAGASFATSGALDGRWFDDGALFGVDR
jgi:hypothetical protein